jgi:hypothetical protein
MASCLNIKGGVSSSILNYKLFMCKNIKGSCFFMSNSKSARIFGSNFLNNNAFVVILTQKLIINKLNKNFSSNQGGSMFFDSKNMDMIFKDCYFLFNKASLVYNIFFCCKCDLDISYIERRSINFPIR